MLSVSKMYELMSKVAFASYNNDFYALSYDLSHNDSDHLDSADYKDLYELYHSYHAFLDIELCKTFSSKVPDEIYWKTFCNVFFNWKVHDREFCISIKDIGLQLQFGQVRVPAFMVHFSPNKRILLVAPRVFPYTFVVPYKYEHCLDAEEVKMHINMPDSHAYTRLLQKMMLIFLLGLVWITEHLLNCFQKAFVVL